MIILSGHQPNFLPWIGYFEKIALSDVFTYSNDVEYTDKSFINRTKLLINDKETYLTIPVKHINDFLKISEKKIIKDNKIIKKILNTFYINFKRAKYFNEIEPLLSVIQKSYEESETIDIFNIRINNFLIDDILNLNIKRAIGTDLKLDEYKLNERIVKNCKLLNATVYLSGSGAKSYNDPNYFISENISLKYYNSLFATLIPQNLIKLSIIQIILLFGSNFIREKLSVLKENRGRYLID